MYNNGVILYEDYTGTKPQTNWDLKTSWRTSWDRDHRAIDGVILFRNILASKARWCQRFCIDYRKLNDCTKSASWPMPQHTTDVWRLGTHHSDIFGVMDFAIFHQHRSAWDPRILNICFLPEYSSFVDYHLDKAGSIMLSSDGLRSSNGTNILYMRNVNLDDCIIVTGPEWLPGDKKKVLQPFRTYIFP
jgi:hypothetical protein